MTSYSQWNNKRDNAYDYEHGTSRYSSAQNPPSYNAAAAAIRFDGQGDDMTDARHSSSTHHRQRSDATRLPTLAFDSSRAVADEQYDARDRSSNGAGIGAGRNAYMAPDTPSMYTDPHEYASTVAGGAQRYGGGPGTTANVMGTRPDPNFLENDPYPSRPYRASQLDRSNTIGTLAPGDSVSAYNLDARSRDIGTDGTFNPDETDDYYRRNEEYGDDGYHDYHNRAYNDSRMSHDYHDGAHGDRQGNFNASGATLPLKDNAAYMGYADDEEEEKRQREYYWNGGNAKGADEWTQRDAPVLFANNMQGAGGEPLRKSGDDPVDDRRGLLGALSGRRVDGSTKPGWGGSVGEQIERRQNGIGRQRWPYLSWAFSVSFVVVFIIELIKAKAETGQAIQTKPSINPMIGPPSEFLISFGARFVPCMRKVPDVPLTTPLICLKDLAQSSVPSDQTCPLYQICGLPDANTYGQAYRFITPMFLHAGFVHIGFNLLAQLTLGSQIEKIFSSPVFLIVFVAGGLGGNLLGGNFGLVGLPSVGASGAIYACISLELTDLLYNWKYEHRPVVRLVMSIVFTVIGFAIGLLPGLDNFAHIGGFAVGILGGAMLGPSIHETRRHRIVTWCVRVLAAALLVAFFVGLSLNFYNSEDPNKACTWCRYLSCLPVFSQCKGNGLTITSTPARR